MRIRALRLYGLQVPLRINFEHSGASRRTSDNLVVSAELESGTVGYGEGVPRSYVTGEDVEDSFETLVGMGVPAPVVGSGGGSFRAVEALVGMIPDEGGVIRNATRAALEIALLDAWSRDTQEPLAPRLREYVGGHEGPVAPHSLVLGRQDTADDMRGLRDRYDFRALKVKVGFDLDEDLSRLRTVRDVFGSDVDVRLDANRAWSDEEARRCLARMQPYGVTLVEDPLRGAGPDLVERLCRLREETGYGVIVDETLRTLEEARSLIAGGAADVFSIRLSKNGGLIPSARIAVLAQSHGIDIQLGCQVGETAILSAAAMRFAFSLGSIRYLENANESLKFEREHYVAREDLTYGPDTMARSQPGLGLGIDVLPDRLARFAVRQEVLRA